MQTNTHFHPTERYEFDCGRCSLAKGWAQVDTEQDAPHFGTWTNPTTLEILSYCEGDVTVQLADNPEEYVEALRYLKKWNEEMGWKFGGIDGGCKDTLIARFTELGVGDLLH